MIAAIIILSFLCLLGAGVAAGVWYQRIYDRRLQAGRPMPSPNVSYESRTMLLRRAAERAQFDPTNALEVSEQQLLDAPESFHGRSIRSTGTWLVGFEASHFAHAWVNADGIAPPQGSHKVRIAGVWNFPRPVGSVSEMPGFGHLGMSWGELRVYEVEWL